MSKFTDTLSRHEDARLYAERDKRDKRDARVAQLEDALNELLAHNTIDFGDKEKARQALSASSETWLAEHDKAVEVKVLEDANFSSDPLILSKMIKSRKLDQMIQSRRAK